LIRIETTYNINSICPELVNRSKKEGLWFTKDILFFVVFNINEPIAFFGLKIGASKAVIKCDYVSKKYRRQGLLYKFILYRINYLKENYPNIKKITASTTELATNVHLKLGAEFVEKYKCGLTLVEYNI
jgi:hypothetical protein